VQRLSGLIGRHLERVGTPVTRDSHKHNHLDIRLAQPTRLPVSGAGEPKYSLETSMQNSGWGLAVACAAMSWMASSGALAADQTQVGAGNAIAETTGAASPLVQSAKRLLIENANRIEDSFVRETTLDAFNNSRTCIAHRIGVTDTVKNEIVQQLELAGLLNPADAAAITGGVKAGVFPPILDEKSPCPHLPLSFDATPGSNFGGHHSYPGGLAVHESFNDQSSINFANTYRGEYAQTGPQRLPAAAGSRQQPEDGFISQDVILAAPIWHDWAKMLVFQWNADGTEFAELNFGGAGSNDNFGAAGDSRTGGHHILSMARGLPPELVITQASAHSAPTLGNEFKVVNWLRAAAIVARIDPVEKGYLAMDAKGNLRLPALLALGDGVNLVAQGQTNLLLEYQIHNLSDADFVNSIPSVTEAQVLLQTVAPQFGFNPADTATYNNKFRNVVLAFLSPEHLSVEYSQHGIKAVIAEIERLKALHII
jgi:hypothetical protein